MTPRLLLASLLLALALTPALAQPDTTHYTILLSNHPAGQELHWQTHNGMYHVLSHYNDRGRGDSLYTRYRLNDQGYLTWLRGQGHDYYKSPVQERFTWAQGQATWKNNAEDTLIPLTTPAYYMPLSVNPGNYLPTILQHGGEIPLLPSGTLRATHLHTYPLPNQGGNIHLYQISGLGLTPTYTWYRPNGQYFATVSSWSSTILAPYTPQADTLLHIQTTHSDRFFEQIPERAILPRTGPLLIHNVRLFHAPTAQTTPNSWVHIQADTIANTGQGTPPQNLPNTTYLNGQGKFLMPGLIDMHTHGTDPYAALNHLACGVTSIRDLGGNLSILPFSQKVNQGTLVGPTYERIAALLDGAGPFAGPTPFLASSQAQALHLVDTIHTLGYDQVKIYSSIKPEWVPAIIQRAKSHGLRVSGHIPAYMSASQAVQAGYHEIQHINMVFLNFMGDTIDTRTPLRFHLPAQHAASINLQGPEVSQFIQLLQEKQVVVDPTLTIFDGLFRGRPGVLDPAYAPIFSRLPSGIQRQLSAGGGGLPAPQGLNQTYLDAPLAFAAMTRRLHEAGITLVAGTDGWAGFTLQRELENYVLAGIPNAQVLQIATWNGAQVLGKSDQIGAIRPGYRANLILINGDPLTHMSHIRRVDLLIKDGQQYNLDVLLHAVNTLNYHEIE